MTSRCWCFDIPVVYGRGTLIASDFASREAYVELQRELDWLMDLLEIFLYCLHPDVFGRSIDFPTLCYRALQAAVLGVSWLEFYPVYYSFFQAELLRLLWISLDDCTDSMY